MAKMGISYRAAVASATQKGIYKVTQLEAKTKEAHT